MPLLQVRVTDELTDTLKSVAVWCDKLKNNSFFLCCQEMEPNKHCHILCDYKLSRSNFVTLFNKEFPSLIGNKKKSISDVRTNYLTMIEYISKGEEIGVNPIVLLSKIAPEQVVEHHIEYWSKYGRIKEANLIAARAIPFQEVKAKAKKETWFEKLCDSFVEDVGVRKFSWEQTDVDYIVEYVLRKLGHSRKMLDEFIVKRFVMGLYNYIVVHNGENEAVTEQVVRLRSKIFPDL